MKTKKLTTEEIKRASKVAEKNMAETLKTWHPTDLRALQALRDSYNNFTPLKGKK